MMEAIEWVTFVLFGCLLTVAIMLDDWRLGV
jgi:hypothetical protein